MSDTFRIKPLVWERESEGAEYAQVGHLHVAVHPHDYGHWQVDITAGRPELLPIYSVVVTSKERARARAESAYRDLLMAALEPA
jgi:hypothetical protein